MNFFFVIMELLVNENYNQNHFPIRMNNIYFMKTVYLPVTKKQKAKTTKSL